MIVVKYKKNYLPLTNSLNYTERKKNSMSHFETRIMTYMTNMTYIMVYTITHAL